MPELPEVETTLRGVLPHLAGRTVTDILVREPRLRQPVPAEIHQLAGHAIEGGSRRSKYMLFGSAPGTLLIHLGMSGSLRLADDSLPLRKHDHVILTLDSGRQLRYHDPRRFGLMLWVQGDPMQHPLLQGLGPEPLERGFDATYMHNLSRGRSTPIKTFIMNAQVVVGIGNIYACESLFLSGIHPATEAGKLGLDDYARLVSASRKVLRHSIRMGGSTLRDFVREDGQPGYFKQRLRVYGREKEPCLTCGTPIAKITQNQRSTFFCPTCQPWR